MTPNRKIHGNPECDGFLIVFPKTITEADGYGGTDNVLANDLHFYPTAEREAWEEDLKAALLAFRDARYPANQEPYGLVVKAVQTHVTVKVEVRA